MTRRPRASSFLLTLRLRSRRCWTSWRLRRSRSRLRREERRTLALQLALDSSLLRQKELLQQVQQAEHRLAEMADSLAFRTQAPPQPPPPPVEEPLVPEVFLPPLLDQLRQPSVMEQVLRGTQPPPEQETVTLPKV